MVTTWPVACSISPTDVTLADRLADAWADISFAELKRAGSSVFGNLLSSVRE